MEKRFYLFMLLSVAQLQASNALVIPKNLGKPPLAKPQERVALQMKRNRQNFQQQNLKEYFDFLNALLRQIEQNASTENTETVFAELMIYYDAVKKELEAVGQAFEFEQQQQARVVAKELKYFQEAQNILNSERLSLSPKDYKKRVKELRDLTDQALLNDNIPFEEVCRLQVAFNVFSDAYQSLQ